MVGNDFEVLVGQHERAGKGQPSVWGVWEWQGRCPSLMHDACSRQLPFVSCFELGRHVWAAGLARHEDWAGREGERQASTPSRAAESRCLERNGWTLEVCQAPKQLGAPGEETHGMCGQINKLSQSEATQPCTCVPGAGCQHL